MEYKKLAGTSTVMVFDNTWHPLDTKGRLYELTVQQGVLGIRADTRINGLNPNEALTYQLGQTVSFVGRADVRSEDGGTLICHCLAFDPV